ncbi:MAG: hypothetical protein JNG83_14405 [Opitutaceae bacterium]|nr:hypothetical protein [Opitutaceae bacterium]
MKTALIAVLAAALLSLTLLAGGRPFDAADLCAVSFTTGLVAWTIRQYRRPSRSLIVDRPIRLAAPSPRRASRAFGHSLAA